MSFLKAAMSTLETSKSTMQKISIDNIHNDPINDALYPEFDPDSCTEDRDLVVSIKEVGLLQPLCLRRHASLPNEYVVVAGHRRLCACRIANIKMVESLILSVDTEEDDITVKMSLVLSNRTRDRSNPAIQAKEVAFLETHMRSLKKINPDRFKGFTIRSLIAAELGISERTVASVEKISNNLSQEKYDDFLNGKMSQKEALQEADKHREAATISAVETPDNFTSAPPSTKITISNFLYSSVLHDSAAQYINNKSAFLDDVKKNHMRSHHGASGSLFSFTFELNGLLFKLPGKREVRLTPSQIYDATLWAYQAAKQQTVDGKVDAAVVPVEVPVEDNIKESKTNEFDVVALQKTLMSCVSILSDNPEIAQNPEVQFMVLQLQNKLISIK